MWCLFSLFSEWMIFAILKIIKLALENDVTINSSLYTREHSIFLDKETLTLFGYIEIENEEKWSKSADTEICEKWWNYMADIMETNLDNSPKTKDLKNVFHLD